MLQPLFSLGGEVGEDPKVEDEKGFCKGGQSWEVRPSTKCSRCWWVLAIKLLCEGRGEAETAFRHSGMQSGREERFRAQLCLE